MPPASGVVIPEDQIVVYVRPPPGTPAGIRRPEVPLRVYEGVPGSVIRVQLPRVHTCEEVFHFTLASALGHWESLAYCPISAPEDFRLELQGEPLAAKVGPFCPMTYLEEGVVLDGVWKLPFYIYEAKAELNAV